MAQSSDVADQIGRGIQILLNKASENMKANLDHSVQKTHELSLQLRTVEDSIRKLEAEVAQWEERATTAENWLNRISFEVKRNFLQNSSVSNRDLEFAGRSRPER